MTDAADRPASSGRPLLYLDIDGTLLLRRPQTDAFQDAYEPDPDALDFLTWAAARFECRWLSTRCRNGSADGALRAFRFALGAASLPPDWRAVLGGIPASGWSALKLEGIALAHPAGWWWVDDAPEEADLRRLAELGLEERLIRLDHGDPHALRRVRERLEGQGRGDGKDHSPPAPQP